MILFPEYAWKNKNKKNNDDVNLFFPCSDEFHHGEEKMSSAAPYTGTSPNYKAL